MLVGLLSSLGRHSFRPLGLLWEVPPPWVAQSVELTLPRFWRRASEMQGSAALAPSETESVPGARSWRCQQRACLSLASSVPPSHEGLCVWIHIPIL